MSLKRFEVQRTVGPQDIDELHHVNNVVFLQWIMDIAQEHWRILSTDALRQSVSWVVLRHEIDYHRSARLHDQIIISTWVGETSGVRSIRHVEILDQQRRKIVSAKTAYCCIDTVSFRPMRISEEIMALLNPESN